MPTLLEAVAVPATNVPAQTTGQTYTGAEGFRFTPTVDINIATLGAFISPNNPNNWTNPVPVKIFRESDQATVASLVLPANRSGLTVIGSMAYGALSTAFKALAGATYRVATLYTPPDAFALGYNGPVDSTGNITFYNPGAVQNHDGTGLNYPDQTGDGGNAGYIGPSFQYSVAPQTATAPTATTVTGQTSGAVGSAATFTFGVNGNTGSNVTVTPSMAGLAGTWSPASLSIAPGATATSSFTASAVGTGTPTAANSAGLTVGTAATFTAAVALLAGNIFSGGGFFSPHYFRVMPNGSIATVYQGNYVKLGFTGTSCAITFDVSAMRAGGLAANAWPVVRIIADEGVIVDYQLADPGSDTLVYNVTGLNSVYDSTFHTLFLTYYAESGNERWTPNSSGMPTQSFCLKSFAFSSGGAQYPLSINTRLKLHSKTNKVKGDSITQGIWADAYSWYVKTMNLCLDAEFSVGGDSGDGWTRGGEGNIPAFTQTWNFDWAGASNLDSNGKFKGNAFRQLDYAHINEGTNDAGGGVTLDPAAVTAVLAGIRAASSPTTKICMQIPFGVQQNGGYGASMNTQLYSIYGAFAATDPYAKIIDLGLEGAEGLGFAGQGEGGGGGTFAAPDSLHPYSLRSMELGALLGGTILRAFLYGGSNGAVHTITTTFTSDSTGTPVTDRTGLKWAFYDQATPDLVSSIPSGTGTGSISGGAGAFTITSPTNLAQNAVGFLVVTDSDGTTTQSPRAKVFAGPVTVGALYVPPDTTAPTFGTPHVEDSAKSIVVFAITEPNTPTLNGTASGVTLGGAAASGKTVSSVAVSGNSLNITLSAPLAYGDVLTVALAAGMVKDASNNMSAAVSATTVTNNVAAPVSSTLTLGTPAYSGYSANTTVDMPTVGALDWIDAGNGGIKLTPGLFTKTTANLAYVGGASGNLTMTAPANSWAISGTTQTSALSDALHMPLWATTTTQDVVYTFAVPVPASTARVVTVLLNMSDDGSSNGVGRCTVTASLANGSASPVSVVMRPTSDGGLRYCSIAVNVTAGSATTLSIALKKLAADVSAHNYDNVVAVKGAYIV